MAKEPKTNGDASAKTDAAAPSEYTERRLRGMIFKFPNRFKVGQVLTAEDALLCNSARASLIASGFSDRLAAMLDPNRTEKQEDGTEKKLGRATDREIYEKFTAYEENYVYNPRGDSTPLDPVEAEIRKIARSKLTAGLKAKGLTLQGLPKEEQDNALNLYITKHREKLEKEAKKILAEAEASLDDDIIGKIGARKVGEKAESTEGASAS